jgi:hypothetical protein
MIDTDFCCGLVPGLTEYTVGTGQLSYGNGRENALWLRCEANDGKRYSDAQIMDYAGLQRRDYPNTPPLRLAVRAAFSHPAEQFRGTAGFGLWNQPFMPGQRWPRLPRAAWFFLVGQPGNIKLAKDTSGAGWKAATLDATRLPFLLLAPGAPLGFLLIRNRVLYQRLYPLAERALGIAESAIQIDITQTHTYQMDWTRQGLRFSVDDQLVLDTKRAPRGRLGFIAWVDNQYAVVTPQGAFGFGLTPQPEAHWLRIEQLRLEPLS